MRPIQTLILLALAAALAACQAANEPLSSNFGEAVRRNMAAHIINPVPTVAEPDSGLDGSRAGDAWQRYREGKVIKPRSLETSDDMVTQAPNR